MSDRATSYETWSPSCHTAQKAKQLWYPSYLHFLCYQLLKITVYLPLWLTCQLCRAISHWHLSISKWTSKLAGQLNQFLVFLLPKMCLTDINFPLNKDGAFMSILYTSLILNTTRIWPKIVYLSFSTTWHFWQSGATFLLTVTNNLL